MKPKNFKVNGSIVLDKMLRSEKPEFILEGSTGSTKTYSAVTWIALMCILSKNPVVARSYRVDAVDCKNAVGKDFETIMRLMGPRIWDGGKTYNKQNACFTFPNGSRYYFAGTDPKRLPGYRQHVAHLDEATKMDYDSYNQIKLRTSNKMIYTFNPELMTHWLYDVVLAQDPSKFEYIHSTYKDNKHLTPEIIDTIEATNPALGLSTADDWYWQVYGLGKRARREGAIYTRWETTTEWPKRNTCSRYGYGLDFGFSVDPSTLVECALHQDFLYVREVFYKKGLQTLRSLDNPNVPCIQNELELAEIPKSDKIVSDARYPSDISSLQNCGYNAIKSKCGAEGRILSGIDKVRQFMVKVHIGSNNIQQELQNYTWKQNPRTKETYNEPVDHDNHALDAIRYWAVEELDQTKIVGQKERLKALNELSFVSEFQEMYG